MSSRAIDLVGKRYGRLVVKERVWPNAKGGHARWACLCTCGTTKTALARNLVTGDIQSCGCLRAQVSRERKIQPIGVANFNTILRSYQGSAKRRNLAWKLTDDEFRTLTVATCAYCGASPSTVHNDLGSNGAYTYNGVDRVDNDKGYEPSNVVSCCKTCNIAKRALAVGDFHNWASNLYHTFIANGLARTA